MPKNPSARPSLIEKFTSLFVHVSAVHDHEELQNRVINEREYVTEKPKGNATIQDEREIKSCQPRLDFPTDGMDLDDLRLAQIYADLDRYQTSFRISQEARSLSGAILTPITDPTGAGQSNKRASSAQSAPTVKVIKMKTGSSKEQVDPPRRSNRRRKTTSVLVIDPKKKSYTDRVRASMN